MALRRLKADIIIIINEKGVAVLDLTANCIAKFKEILSKEEKLEAGVRLFIAAGG